MNKYGPCNEKTKNEIKEMISTYNIIKKNVKTWDKFNKKSCKLGQLSGSVG